MSILVEYYYINLVVINHNKRFVLMFIQRIIDTRFHGPSDYKKFIYKHIFDFIAHRLTAKENIVKNYE